MKWLWDSICSWMYFFVHAKDLLPPMTKCIIGRFYVFRDSPDYVVELFADFDTDNASDGMERLILMARQEQELRQRRAAA